jgi:hypothetical protein
MPLNRQFRVANEPTTRMRQITTVASDSVSRVPFEGSIIAITTSAAGVPHFYNLSGTDMGMWMGLDPNDSDQVFGSAILNMSTGWRQFRVAKLTAEYIPSVATSTSGSLCIGYMPDSGYPDTHGGYSPQAVTSWDGALTTPVWDSGFVGLRGLDTTWKFVADPTAATAAELRQDHAGTFAICSFATLANSTNYGFLKLGGVLEFKGLGAVANNPPILRARAAAAAAACAASADYSSTSSSQSAPLLTVDEELVHVTCTCHSTQNKQPPPRSEVAPSSKC